MKVKTLNRQTILKSHCMQLHKKPSNWETSKKNLTTKQQNQFAVVTVTYSGDNDVAIITRFYHLFRKLSCPQTSTFHWSFGFLIQLFKKTILLYLKLLNFAFSNLIFQTKNCQFLSYFSVSYSVCKHAIFYNSEKLNFR